MAAQAALLLAGGIRGRPLAMAHFSRDIFCRNCGLGRLVSMIIIIIIIGKNIFPQIIAAIKIIWIQPGVLLLPPPEGVGLDGKKG